MNEKTCPVAQLDKLLLSTDGSQFSEGAIQAALSLAKWCSSALLAVFVIKTNLEFEVTMLQVIEKEEAEAVSHLEALLRKVDILYVALATAVFSVLML